tara:strand:- start:7559 stop:8164 length:606 start_codon:yes stop_codon:yes gene_type:complete
MMKDKLKFKKLLNEFRSLEFEHEYNSEILKEVGQTFESACNDWCEKNNIDIDNLMKTKFPNRVQSPPVTDDGSIHEPKVKTSKHKDIFKSIAKKFHPDKIKEKHKEEEMKSAFQKASSAMQEEQWGELFDVIDKYEIEISDYNEANASLEKDIVRMQEKLKVQKSTFTWHFGNCDGDPACIDFVMEMYMKQVLGWNGPEQP